MRHTWARTGQKRRALHYSIQKGVLKSHLLLYMKNNNQHVKSEISRIMQIAECQYI